MKLRKLYTVAAMISLLAATTTTSCYKGELYDINEPEWLADRQAEAAKNNEARAAAERAAAEAAKAAFEARMVEDVYQAGLTSNASGFFSQLSKYYRLNSVEDTVVLRFKNFTSGNNVWCNWLAAVTSDADRGSAGYVEYCVWRADNCNNYAWGAENGTSWNTENEVPQRQNQTLTNYPDATSNDDHLAWDNKMNGADCYALITRDGDKVNVNVEMTARDGSKFTKQFFITENGLKSKPVRVFFGMENAHLVFYKYLLGGSAEVLSNYEPGDEVDPDWNSSEQIIIEDPTPVKIEVTGTPSVIDFTEDVESVDYKGANFSATVTFSDGKTAVVSADDCVFQAPDLSSKGSKEVIVMYNKTKGGNISDKVAAIGYTFVFGESIESLEIVNNSKIYTVNGYDVAIPHLTVNGVTQSGDKMDVTSQAEFSTSGNEITVSVSGLTAKVSMSSLPKQTLTPYCTMVGAFDDADAIVRNRYRAMTGTMNVSCSDLKIVQKEFVGPGWWITDEPFYDAAKLADGEALAFSVELKTDGCAFLIEPTDGTKYFSCISPLNSWGATVSNSYPWAEGNDYTDYKAGDIIIVTIARDGNNLNMYWSYANR